MIGSALSRCDHFGESKGVWFPQDLDGCTALVLWGGGDISPSLYDEPSVHAHAANVLSTRDRAEVELAKAAKEKGIPIIGVCRGMQLVCALDGGKLWQNVNNHVVTAHRLRFKDGEEGLTNSFHHQMIIPNPDTGVEILATTTECRSPIKWRANDKPHHTSELEPEAAYFPEWKCLGVQGHPEWLPQTAFLNKKVRELAKKYLGLSL